ncbi:methylated-DNA--[protein]-cysteine S-methyltransferase [Methanococcoides sp. SA1]|nr:methylated-DNA--[protein]-cysteine S-methyltransferase [Methanococcoides sp. SA1]
MYYDLMQTGLVGELFITGDNDGLKRVCLLQGKTDLVIPSDWIRDEVLFSDVKGQLGQYFKGNLKEFDIRLSPEGTSFQKLVWDTLTKIPFGKTVTYADVAKMIGRPKAVRAVGAAIGANPILMIIPCHRVIGSSGKLTGFSSGLENKILLLEHEGMKIKGSGSSALVI